MNCSLKIEPVVIISALPRMWGQTQVRDAFFKNSMRLITISINSYADKLN